MRHYSLKQQLKAFTIPSEPGNSAFPTTCVECGSRLRKNEDFDYMNEWTISYTCKKCGRKYAYQLSDMGQSVPLLVQYKNKEDVFKK